jgi:hypothetical protein
MGTSTDFIQHSSHDPAVHDPGEALEFLRHSIAGRYFAGSRDIEAELQAERIL